MRLFISALLFCWSLSIFAYHEGDVVKLVVRDGCTACEEAQQLLNSKHIKYSIEQGNGFVPQLYVNNKYVGLGTEIVREYVNNK